jgi:glycosyltransferase involved in cell wall biosynthesis
VKPFYSKNQTYKYWRFLIIDDGSDKNNKTIFNELKQNLSIFNKVIFLENDINCQVAKTLNKGIEYFLNNNKFTHFTWISDDNEYYSNFLQDLVLNNNYFKYIVYISHSICLIL